MFIFFQAEDGIRDIGVTGVQTCALPISDIFLYGTPAWPVVTFCIAYRNEWKSMRLFGNQLISSNREFPFDNIAFFIFLLHFVGIAIKVSIVPDLHVLNTLVTSLVKIGRASCRERV